MDCPPSGPIGAAKGAHRQAMVAPDERAAAPAAGVMDALRRLVRGLRLSDRAAERDLGVSSAQLFVLQRLASSPPMSLTELATRTLTDASSVSEVVARLVERDP